ncbi:hypothetical protein OsI_23783 [Oryza sativa Indica Group]|uniref:Uncharacterized protein n=1 Tax=Oryza sativa subsp. indica TaxID=39946 RepID=A2YF91_ORYSI|nr:hypothetical protein OsI_23783 [Oryza sativa Indica Group]
MRMILGRLLVVAVLAAAAAAAESEPRLPAAEQEGVYAVLEAVNPGFPWRASFPDDLCLAGPHGVSCDDDDGGNASHVVGISLGYVSDFSANPSCAAPSAATLLTSGLLAASFPRLRSLFVYGCFVGDDDARPLPPLPWRLPPTLQDLVLLVLSGSRFAGRIPSALVQGLANVKILDLSSNLLAGGIPRAIGGLTQLVKLDLSSNTLAGPIPGELGGLASLELLDLSNNRLTGGVPAALRGMTAIREMYLSGNRRLGGSVPADMFAGLKGISAVGLSDAGLTGTIPASLGESLRNVTYLGLDGNLLEGEVPPALAKMAGRVRLHGNRAVCISPEFLAGAPRPRIAGVPSCNATQAAPVTRRPVVMPVPLASAEKPAAAAAPPPMRIGSCVVVAMLLLMLS